MNARVTEQRLRMLMRIGAEEVPAASGHTLEIARSGQQNRNGLLFAASLGLIDAAYRLAVEGSRPDPVDRIGGEGHQASVLHHPQGFLDGAGLIGGDDGCARHLITPRG